MHLTVSLVLPKPAKDIDILLKQFRKVIDTRATSDPKVVMIVDNVENANPEQMSRLLETLMDLHLKKKLSIIFISSAERPEILSRGMPVSLRLICDILQPLSLKPI